jgi:hypothetical protein
LQINQPSCVAQLQQTTPSQPDTTWCALERVTTSQLAKNSTVEAWGYYHASKMSTWAIIFTKAVSNHSIMAASGATTVTVKQKGKGGKMVNQVTHGIVVLVKKRLTDNHANLPLSFGELPQCLPGSTSGKVTGHAWGQRLTTHKARTHVSTCHWLQKAIRVTNHSFDCSSVSVCSNALQQSLPHWRWDARRSHGWESRDQRNTGG